MGFPEHPGGRADVVDSPSDVDMGGGDDAPPPGPDPGGDWKTVGKKKESTAKPRAESDRAALDPAHANATIKKVAEGRVEGREQVSTALRRERDEAKQGGAGSGGSELLPDDDP
jgi:hypothetical protein